MSVIKSFSVSDINGEQGDMFYINMIQVILQLLTAA